MAQLLMKPHTKSMPNKFYLTSSIPYANAKPHLGHAMEFIEADVIARWYRQQGVKTRLQIGTDEHGQKLYEAAAEAGVETNQFVAGMSQTFVDLAKRLDVSYDYFVRTTDAEHKLAAQKLWQACSHDIYKGQYSGLYCVACELFYTVKDAVDNNCPVHPNRRLEELTIDSYFLKLAPYQAKLISAIESDDYRVFPALRKNEILNWLKSTQLEDLSISRPKSQLVWGVEVPDDADHVMYVWFDALANYITTIGYNDPAKFNQWWPADLHIVGKDINRFHSVFWPIMLMSAKVVLPKALYVHGFINAPGGAKMSKSLGNSVDPIEILNSHGSDALRYYLLRYIPHNSDGEFSRDRFQAVYTADLANDLGNLIQRVAKLLIANNDSQYDPAVESPDLKLPEKWVDNCDFDGALTTLFGFVNDLNKAIDQAEPWRLIKSDKPQAVKFLSEIIAQLLAIAELLLPFMPIAANKIAATFANGQVDASIGVLFPRVEALNQPPTE